MPRYYCDFCDAYLTHDSASVRKQHNTGFKHKSNVRNYYQQFLDNLPGSAPAGGAPGMMPGYTGGPFPPRFDASSGLRPLGPGMGGPPGGMPPFRPPPYGSAPPPWQPPPGGYRPPYGGPPPGMPPPGMPPPGMPPPMGAPPPGMPPGM